jgi:hypothetical protein
VRLLASQRAYDQAVAALAYRFPVDALVRRGVSRRTRSGVFLAP